MGAQIREYRQRIRSVSATKKITRAMELMAASRVVKAFNTTFGGALAKGGGGDQKISVLVAGDDAGAKQAVVDVVTSGGLRALDAGSLSRARELEAVGFLQLTLAVTEKVGWTGGFVLLALLLAVDPIVDMGRTATNVAGQALVPALVAKQEGILDQARYDAERVDIMGEDEEEIVEARAQDRDDDQDQMVGAAARPARD